MPDALETAIDTFATHTEMTEREAEAYVRRTIADQTRGEVAFVMDASTGVVDALAERATPKATLPNVDTVERVPAADAGFDGDDAWAITFANGAVLRYGWSADREQLVRTTTRADDPTRVTDRLGVGGSEAELEAFTLEVISEYTCRYRDDIDACREEWTSVYEALVCHEA